MCGWSFGLQVLNLVRISDPTARGAAVGCTYFSAGAAQLVNAEPVRAALCDGLTPTPIAFSCLLPCFRTQRDTGWDVQEAAGAASVVFALNGVLATFLVAFPPFRHLLCTLAGMPLV